MGKEVLRALLVAVACLVTGCSSTRFEGQRPISPELGEKVDSLQPTLRWEPAGDEGATYDLAVVMAVDNWQKNAEDSYYREGLKVPECRVEAPLKPNQIYYWAVRVRRGSNVSAWSSYENAHNSGLWTTTKYGLHYYFTTPGAPTTGPAATK